MSQGNINININITNSKKSDSTFHKVSNLVIDRTPKFETSKDREHNFKTEKSSFQVNFRKNTDHLIYSKFSDEGVQTVDVKRVSRRRLTPGFSRSKEQLEPKGGSGK